MSNQRRISWLIEFDFAAARRGPNVTERLRRQRCHGGGGGGGFATLTPCG